MRRGNDTDLFTSIACLGSIAVSLFVLGLKVVAWQMTGSVALYSDAMESFVNVAGAGLAWLAIRIADQPADDGHQFGHHKAENFSAIAEGSLIVVAAILVIREAWSALWAPSMEHLDTIGLIVSAAGDDHQFCLGPNTDRRRGQEPFTRAGCQRPAFDGPMSGHRSV